MSETCSETRWDGWRSHPCGKPAKGHGDDGKPLCGRHLAGLRRRHETARQYAETWERKEHARKLAEAERALIDAAVAERAAKDEIDGAETLGQHMTAIENYGLAESAYDDAVAALLAARDDDEGDRR